MELIKIVVLYLLTLIVVALILVRFGLGPLTAIILSFLGITVLFSRIARSGA